MKPSPPADREEEALARFQEDERSLEAALEVARQDAAAILEAADRDAEQVLRDVAATTEGACARMRDAAGDERRAAVEAERASAREELAEIARRASRNGAETVGWLLAIVAGERGGPS